MRASLTCLLYTSVFVNGLRKTDADTMEIAEMVLKKVNKSLVTLVEELGVQAVSYTHLDVYKRQL